MYKRILTTIIFIFLVIVTTIGIILYSRGYRFNIQNKAITGTGILSASSYPDKASIFVDGKLTTATSGSVSLPPAWYTIRISKEGYQSWEKKIQIQNEVLTQIDALLIPTNPSLRSITVNGIVSPVLSPNGSKIAYIVPESTSSSVLKPKTGIWVLDLRNGPLGGRSGEKQIFEPQISYDWQNVVLTWSPDEKQLIAIFYRKDKKELVLTQALLFSTDNGNIIPTEITTTYKSVLDEWKQTADEKEKMRMSALPKEIVDTLTNKVSGIRFSPDETKILYLATASAKLVNVINPPLIGSNSTEGTRDLKPGSYYVYDQKEDKNFQITNLSSVPDPKYIMWYADSKHIMTVEKNTILATDYDGTNKRTVYGGPFVTDFVFPWPTGERMLIMTNFSNSATLPNLYELDLR